MKNIRGCLVLTLWSAVVCGGCGRGAETPKETTPPPAAATPADFAFRDAVDAPPPGWSGPVFKLSRAYPAAPPDCDAPWLQRKVDFNRPGQKWPGANNAWSDYVQDIIDYVKEGQDPELRDEIGWRTDVGGNTRWFHVPWMAYDGERGREFVHGLTNELSTAESTFDGPGRGFGAHRLPGARQRNGVDPLFETWSVGMYNPCGAATVGQGWPASGEPATYKDDRGRLLASGMPFPEGTVVIKVLNTTADESTVPYLKGSTSWQANGHKQTGPTTYSTCEREVRRVHLVQIDLAVVDSRSPTRWVYSTLAYDGTLPGKTIWDRLKPLGVQWGNDHDSFPAVPQAKSRPLHETLLSPMNIPEHYGCNRRLAGVVDQPNSSCVSCHMGAYSAPPGVLQAQGTNVPEIFAFTGLCSEFNEANANYFSDYAYPAPFPGSTGEIAASIPLDSSLQVQVAFAQYAMFKNPQAPRTCPGPDVVTTNAQSTNGQGTSASPARADAAPASAAPAAAALQLAAHESKPKGSSVPDFGFMVTPAEYAASYADQPVFRLKIDFPKEKPARAPAFVERIDFRKNPLEYLVAARDYSFDGNLPNWNPYDNKKAQWYHIPWLHPTTTGPNAYPPNGGTEGFHGLIKEAPVTPLQLGPGQKGKDGNYSVYAVTLVNDLAGYTLGRMWADPDNPDPRVTDKRYGGGFPPGTVFAKLLFTDAPQGGDTLPFLENPLQWKAYITENFWTSSTRKVTAVNLLQMDLAVRDTRADGPGGTGWVFGSFAYNGQVNNPNKFLNLVPIGLMWGNDPKDTTNTTSPFPPTKTIVNPKLTETVIFTSNQLPPQHLGWNGRLNGPADLNTTSCLSCHITAQYPAVTSLVPTGAVPDGGPTPPAEGGSPEWMKWFQNLPAATSFDPRTYSTDFSFQVAISLQNFFDVKAASQQGAWASDYALPRRPIARGRIRK